MYNAQKVNEFLEVFGTDLPTLPVSLHDVPADKKRLGLALIFEELKELAASMGMAYQEYLSELCGSYVDNFSEEAHKLHTKHFHPETTEHVLDALVDIEVVMHNTTAFFGLSENYQRAFNRVHDANMAKKIDTTNYDNVRETFEHYDDQDIRISISDEGVIRDSNGKIRKPKDWEAAVIGDLAWNA